MRTMRILYWPEELQEHLRETFTYDPVAGEVKRVKWPRKGPKTYGPAGTQAASGDLLMTVIFGSRQWIVRLHKLAVFLQTGKQYTKIMFRDGNRMNIRYDNLLPVGEPEQENMTQSVELKERMKAAAQEHKSKQLSTEKLIEEGRAPRKSTPAEPAENPFVRMEREWRVANPDYKGTWKQWSDEQQAIKDEETRKKYGPIDEARRKAAMEAHELYVKVRYKRGLLTGMKKPQMEMFRDEALAAKNTTLEEYAKLHGNTLHETLVATMEKWEVDLVTACWLKLHEDSGARTPGDVRGFLASYMWKDEWVTGDYDQLDAYHQAWREKREAELEALVAPAELVAVEQHSPTEPSTKKVEDPLDRMVRETAKHFEEQGL